MYYVPDNTDKAGYYECERCGERFLSIQTTEKTDCPYCTADINYEIGPDESIEDYFETGKLIQILEGDDVEKFDTLLSLAITGGDYTWI